MSSPSNRPTAPPRSLSGLLPFLRPYRARIALAALFLVLAAGATLLFPMALRQLIDQGLVPADRGQQTLALKDQFVNLFLVAVGLGLFSALRFYQVSWLGERVSADLRNAVYAHMLRQSPGFYEHTQTGEVLSRLTTDTTLVQTVVGSSLSMGLRNAVMGLGALGMLVWTSPGLMIPVLAILALVVLPAVWFGRRVRRLSRASQDRVADASAIASEVLNAIPVVQSYTAEPREAARFVASTDSAFLTAVRRTKARAALVAFIIIATSAALLYGLYLGTQAVAAGRSSAGELGQTIVYVVILAGAFAVLGEVWGDLLRAAGACERLMELLHTEPLIQSRPQALGRASLAGAGADRVGSTSVSSAGDGSRRVDGAGALSFSQVEFHYPSRPKQAALHDFSLDVRAGETVALVGASGAGKSTVFQLLQRQYDVGSGAIRVEGHDIRDIELSALREHMSVVPQDAVIFSTSALENIRYGRPEATEAEVIEAARAAHAHDFISALPEGYTTFLGERGVRLSGGQRQRIVIARALLKAAPLLLLDEATSALDAESERQVQAALDATLSQRKGQRTTLVIAHRLATVQNADRIVVLDQGRVVELGTHDELIALNGVFARLAALQFTA